MSAIDYRPATALGLDLNGPRVRSFGVSGSVESVISHVNIDVEKGHEHYSFDIPIRVLFSKSDYFAPTLLGRKGFFEKFKVTIDELNQKIILKNNCE